MVIQLSTAHVLALQPLLAGVVFSLAPRWSPKGTLFGVSVGPAYAASSAARRVVRRYRGRNLSLGLVFTSINFLYLWRAASGYGRDPQTLMILLLFLQIAVALGGWIWEGRSIVQAAKGNPEVQAARRADEGWRAGGMIYLNPKDPALLVPKRFGWGLTLNLARPTAWLLLALPFIAALMASLN